MTIQSKTLLEVVVYSTQAEYAIEQAFGGQGMECHDLNVLGPGSGTIWRCGLVGIVVSLWV